MEVSVVVPIMDERENVECLYEQLTETMSQLGRSYEIILVDDGSTDGTIDLLRNLAARDDAIRLVLFRRNYGQSAAMHAGLHHATGEIIVTLDGDLQNDPSDIPRMLEKIDEGYDLVHGWRKDRKDAWLHRKLPSRIANWLISRVTQFPIHDLGCTLKAMRGEIAREIELYGEMHRFIPILAHQRGARCVELEVQHHPRQFGKTKYGIGRTTRVILDLITVKYMLNFFASPMKLFGRFGIACGLLSMAAGVAMLIMKGFSGVDMTGNPLFLLSVITGMVSVQFFSLGLLGEVNARIYFSQQERRNYTVRELVNMERLSKDATAENRRMAA